MKYNIYKKVAKYFSYEFQQRYLNKSISLIYARIGTSVAKGLPVVLVFPASEIPVPASTQQFSDNCI